jgi:hypothetical protein
MGEFPIARIETHAGWFRYGQRPPYSTNFTRLDQSYQLVNMLSGSSIPAAFK